MIVFLSIHFVFFTCWALMYYSEVYRWTWIQWPFFAALTVATQLVMLATGIIGICCWRRFGEGLKHFCKHTFIGFSLVRSADAALQYMWRQRLKSSISNRISFQTTLKRNCRRCHERLLSFFQLYLIAAANSLPTISECAHRAEFVIAICVAC